MARNVDPNFHFNLLAGAASGALGIMVGAHCIAGALRLSRKFQLFSNTDLKTSKTTQYAEAFFITITSTTLSYSITFTISRLLPRLGSAFIAGGVAVPIIMGLTHMIHLAKNN
jgi:hypothetical protein